MLGSFIVGEDGGLESDDENDQFGNTSLRSSSRSLEQNDNSSPSQPVFTEEPVIRPGVDGPSVSKPVSAAPANPLKRKRSAALGTKNKTSTSSAEATALLKNRNDLVELQKQVMMVMIKIDLFL